MSYVSNQSPMLNELKEPLTTDMVGKRLPTVLVAKMSVKGPKWILSFKGEWIGQSEVSAFEPTKVHTVIGTHLPQPARF